MPLFLSGNSVRDRAGMRTRVKRYPPVKTQWVARAASCGDFILPVLSCSTAAPGSCFFTGVQSQNHYGRQDITEPVVTSNISVFPIQVEHANHKKERI